MAATELATAYLSLVPSMRGAQGKIAQELSSVDADGIGKGIGSKMGGGISGSIKGLVGPALAAAGAVLFGGIVAEAAAASDATDKFKSTMNFAGVDTSGIEAATAAAKAYADQTVYDLPTIQATMAQLASNGVKNYKELAEAGGNLNAVAGGNAETFKSVSRSLTQSAGAGKLMTEDWNMLADAIPGASGVLQKSMLDAGAYTGNFKTAMEKGEITATEFQDAITKLGSDPVAVEAARSVTTFEGALGGLKATLLTGVTGALDAMKPALTGAITGVSTGLALTFDKVGAGMSGLKSLIVDGDFTGAMGEAFGLEEDSPAVGAMFAARTAVVEGIPALKSLLIDGDFTGAMRTAFGAEEDSPVVGMLLSIRESAIETFNGLKAALGPVIPDFLDLWSAISPVSTIFQALQPFLAPLLDVFLQLATVVGGSLASAITGLLPSFQSLQATFISLFTDVLSVALPLIVQLVTMLGSTLSELIPILIPIISTIVQLAATLISQLAPIFMQLVSAVLPMVVSSLGLILGAIGPVIEIVAGLLIPIIQALMPVVVMVFGVIVSLITSAMQIIQGIIQVVTGIISGNWSQVFEGLGNIVGGVFSFIVNLVGGALAVLGTLVLGGLSFIGSVFHNIFNGVMGFLGGVWSNITNGVSGMIGNVVGFFSGLMGQIMGAIGNAGAALYDVGKNIIQGLIDGISGMMGAIGRAVLSIVPEAIRGPFEDLMGIHSPSRVAIWWGHMIGEGAIEGLEDMYSPVAEATALLTNAPGAPELGSAFAADSWTRASRPGDPAGGGGGVTQNIYPRENMSETTVADIAARKLERAGIV